MIALWVIALVCAVSLAAGSYLVINSLASRRSFARRLAPWLADVSHEAAVFVTNNSRRDSGLIAGMSMKIARVVGHRGASESIALALRQSGLAGDSSEWSVMVVEFALAGGVLGAFLGVTGALLGTLTWIAAIALVFIGVLSGVFTRRYMLRCKAKRRVAQMLEELPVLTDLIALSLTAGVTFRDALHRVCQHGVGPLADELRGVQREVDMGQPLADALHRLARDLSVTALTRTLDHVITGLERGTPLAGVMRTQAREARAEAARRIQEKASSREVTMLVPLIFLILPVTIAFAIFPGLLVIQAGL